MCCKICDTAAALLLMKIAGRSTKLFSKTASSTADVRTRHFWPRKICCPRASNYVICSCNKQVIGSIPGQPLSRPCRCVEHVFGQCLLASIAAGPQFDLAILGGLHVQTWIDDSGWQLHCRPDSHCFCEQEKVLDTHLGLSGGGKSR